MPARPSPTARCARTAAALGALALALLSGAGPAAASRGGTVDRSFGERGVVEVPLGSRGVVSDLAVDRRGRTLLAGTRERPGGPRGFVARLRRDGRLDRGFARRGIYGGPALATGAEAVAPAANGRIVVATGNIGDLRLCVARLRGDGRVDRGFGRRGVSGVHVLSAGSYLFDAAITVDPEGRVLIAGGDQTEGLGVARYLRDGSPDLGFGGDGSVAAEFGSDSKLGGVVVDRLGAVSVGATAGERQALARWTEDGTPDPTLAGTGQLTFGSGAREPAGIATGSAGTTLVAYLRSRGAIGLGRRTRAGAPAVGFGGSPNGDAEIRRPGGELVPVDFAARPSGAGFVAGSLLPRRGPAGLFVASVGADGELRRSFGERRGPRGYHLARFAGGDATFGTAVAEGPRRTLVAAATRDRHVYVTRLHR